jgi:hypothetical protein
MDVVEASVGVAALMFLSGLVGLYLQRILPEHHTKEHSRDMIGAMIGLITLLLALVLGLLIWTAYGVFSTQKTELQTMAARALEFDLEMTQYGEVGKHGREILRKDLVWAIEQFWGTDESKAAAYDASYANIETMNAFLNGLKPETDAQRALLAQAHAHYGSIGETRLLMSLQLIDAISWPLVITVTSWSCLLFCGFGLLSRVNPTTLTALALGACSVASAIFLILDFSQPYTGPVRISPGAIEQVVLDLDK